MSTIQEWFQTTTGPTIPVGNPYTRTEADIESINENKISVAVVAPDNQFSQLFVAVIYDKIGSGGGTATVDATCNGVTCSNSQVVASVDAPPASFDDVTLSWNNAANDGFVLGPFFGGAGDSACLTHSSLSAEMGELQFVYGNRGVNTVTPNAEAFRFCITFP